MELIQLKMSLKVAGLGHGQGFSLQCSKNSCSHLPICGYSRVSGAAVHLERVFAFHLGIRYRKGVVSISNAQGQKSKCFPYRISSQSSLKQKVVFHEHVSLEYSDCSKMQNCDYGKEKNMQTKCYSILRQSPELSVICSVPGCGICCIWHVQFPRKYETWLCFFSPFFIFPVYHTETL